jgi:hypothetical protein
MTSKIARMYPLREGASAETLIAEKSRRTLHVFLNAQGRFSYSKRCLLQMKSCFPSLCSKGVNTTMLIRALWMLLLQGLLGAFDTLYYHEICAKLPALGEPAHAELKLHAARDFIYALLFVTLATVSWGGYTLAL